MLVDSHCHLDRSSCSEPGAAVLTRARAVGVGGFVVVGVGSVEAAREAVALAEQHLDVVAATGVHPHEADQLESAWPEIEPLFLHPDVVAVGETGLDFHYDHSPRSSQAEAFRRQIAFARARRLPLVIHSRNAPAETLAILEEEQARDVGGVLHCFSEDRAFARRGLDLGFFISFSGIVTFPRAEAIADVVAWAPLERILVETDSPYLAPVPHRGRKCEPAFVVHTAARVAQLRGMTVDSLAEATTANACRCFGPRLAEAPGFGQDLDRVRPASPR